MWLEVVKSYPPAQSQVAVQSLFTTVSSTGSAATGVRGVLRGAHLWRDVVERIAIAIPQLLV